MRNLGLPILVTLLAAGAWGEEEVKVPENPAHPPAGLEVGTWTVEGWGNGGSAELVAAGEAKALKLTCEGGEREKVAFRQMVTLGAASDGKVRLHVYAPQEKSPQVAVVLLTTPELVWHESRPFVLKPGWNALAVALAAPNWKTPATQWKFEAGVTHPEDIQGLGLLVMNEKTAAWLAVVGLATDPDETGKKVTALIEKLQDKDGEVRAQAEAELAAVGRPALAALKQLRASTRPEVALRAGWALDKIEAQVEAERRKEDERKREAARFVEARQRAVNLEKNLQEGREKLQLLAQEAREELVNARAALKDLKPPSEADRKAYLDALEALEKVYKEMVKSLGEPPPKPPAEKAETPE